MRLTFDANVFGTVVKLAEEGSTRAEIVEALRRGAPELADVVDRRGPESSPDFQDWFFKFIAVLSLLFALYTYYHPRSAPLSDADVARIADEVVERLQAAETNETAPRTDQPSSGTASSAKTQ